MKGFICTVIITQADYVNMHVTHQSALGSSTSALVFNPSAIIENNCIILVYTIRQKAQSQRHHG